MARPAFDPWVREILRCPVGLHPLEDVEDERGDAALQCTQDCGAPGQRRRYPVSSGIPTLLADEATLVTVDTGAGAGADTGVDAEAD